MKKLIFLLGSIFIFANDCDFLLKKQKEYLKKAENQIKIGVLNNSYANLSIMYGIMYKNCLLEICLKENNCKNKECLKLFW